MPGLYWQKIHYFLDNTNPLIYFLAHDVIMISPRHAWIVTPKSLKDSVLSNCFPSTWREMFDTFLSFCGLSCIQNIYATNTAGNTKLVLENFKYRSWRLVDLKGYETRVFNEQDDPKVLLNKSSDRIPCSTTCLSRSNLSKVNEYRMYKRSGRMIRTISARYNLRPPHLLRFWILRK